MFNISTVAKISTSNRGDAMKFGPVTLYQQRPALTNDERTVMATKPLPSPELLRQLLRYEPETGKLFWRERPVSMFKSEANSRSWNTRFADNEAFTADSGRGYKIGCIGGKMLKGHRVSWAIFYGEWPDGFLDHINQKRGNNRITNLRNSDIVGNARNSKMSRSNNSGRTGVHWLSNIQKWRAKIGFHGKQIIIGCFDDFGDAVTARENAERKHGYSKRHGSKR